MNIKKPYGAHHNCLRPALCYVLGVMKGDAYLRKQEYHPSRKAEVLYGARCKHYEKLSKWLVALDATDKEFVLKFAEMLEKVIRRPDHRRNDVALNIRTLKKENRKILYRYSRGVTFFAKWLNTLTTSEIHDIILENPAWFLRGFYDSEGNLYLKGWRANIFIYNTSLDSINLANECLNKLNIKHQVAIARPAGTKVKLPNAKLLITKTTLYAIRISGHANVSCFVHLVGSYIPRKSPLPYPNCDCPICTLLRSQKVVAKNECL